MRFLLQARCTLQLFVVRPRLPFSHRKFILINTTRSVGWESAIRLPVQGVNASKEYVNVLAANQLWEKAHETVRFWDILA